MFELFHKKLDDVLNAIRNEKLDTALGIIRKHWVESTREKTILHKLQEDLTKYRGNIRSAFLDIEELNSLREDSENREILKEDITKGINNAKKKLDEIESTIFELLEKEEKLK